jgi:hypothetical protein
MKLAIVVIGLALISCGCASMHPSTNPSATFRPVDNRPQVVQLKQEDPRKEDPSQHNPIVASIYLAGGLAQLGNYLVGAK